MNKSIGLAALCALISPSIALAQESASVDTVISLSLDQPVVEIAGVTNLNFGEVRLPRSNGSAAAQCNIFSILDETFEFFEIFTIDPDALLESSCQLIGNNSTFATFSFGCDSSLPVTVSASVNASQSSSFDLDETPTVFIFNPTGSPQPGGSVDCSLFGGQLGEIKVGTNLQINIKAVEDALLAVDTRVDDLAIGTITVTADY